MYPAGRAGVSETTGDVAPAACTLWTVKGAMAHVAALIAVLPLVAAQSKVVANIQAAEYSGLTISGSVTFEQGADPLGDVTVKS